MRLNYAVILVLLLSAVALTGCPAEYRYSPTGTLKDANGNPCNYAIQCNIGFPADNYYVMVNTTCPVTVQASDYDRQDMRLYSTTSGWSDWVESLFSDDVTSGTTAADAHISYACSRGVMTTQYGTTGIWAGIPPDGAAVDSVVITATVDDNQTGTETDPRVGSPADAPCTDSVTLRVWEVIITSRTSGNLSPNNDIHPVMYGCFYGGGNLSSNNWGDASACGPEYTVDGFYKNIEFKGSVPAAVPGAMSEYIFYQQIRGTIKRLQRSNGQWVYSFNQLGFVDDNGALYGDKDTRHNGADVDEVFARDCPGQVTGPNNDRDIGLYSEYMRDTEFQTIVKYNDVVASVPYSWDAHIHLVDDGGHWKRLE